MQIGIDCGSSFCKGALLHEGAVIALAVRKSGWNMEESAGAVIQELKEKLSVNAAEGAEMPAVPLVATGYGREHTGAPCKIMSEIAAHAKGAEFLHHGIQTVVDIGGQDSKVISVKNGRVLDFLMNDKCAAGSGRFLELVRMRLDVDAALLETLLERGERAALSSTCAVFAESEIIGLLARGVSREAILGGAVEAMALRIAALAGRLSHQPPAALCGGLAQSAGVCRIVGAVLNMPVLPLKNGIYAGAIGAALYDVAQ